MRISDWSSDVCSSDLAGGRASGYRARARPGSVARLRAGHRLAASAEYRTTLPRLIQPELPPARQARRGPLPVSGEELPMTKYAYIGSASCRARVGQSVTISVVAVHLKKKQEP